MIHRKIALLVAFGCLITVASFAATYYVDPSAGSDSNNGTSTTTAWQHIPGSLAAGSGSGWKSLAAGDILYVKGGTVSTDSIVIDSSHYGSGTSSSLIKIMSGNLNGWGTGRAVFDGGASTSGSGTYGKGFYINGPSYIHIEGLEIRNYANVADSGAIYVENGSAHLEIVGNLIHEIYGAPGSSGYGIELTGTTLASYDLVEKNVIYHTEEKAIEEYRNGNSTIRYNWCYQTNDHAIVISSSNNTIYDNLISQSGYKWMTYESPFRPAFGIKFDSDSTTAADGNLLYNNLIWDCSSGIGILNGNNNKIYFNTVYHSGFQGGESGGFEGASLSFKDDNGNGNAGAGNDVRNNVFYYNNILNSSGQTVAFTSAMGSNNTVSDNVIYRDSSQSNTIYCLNSGSSTWWTLSWFQGSSGFSAYGSGNVAANNRAVDPQLSGGTGTAPMSACPTGFTAAWAPNVSTFTLSANTPAAVLAGDVMAAPYNVDITGATRAQFSLGAYEGTGTVVTPPAAPTGLHTVP